MPTGDTKFIKGDDGGSKFVVSSSEDGQITNWDHALQQEVAVASTNETMSETIKTENTSCVSTGQTGQLTVHRKWKVDAALEFKANVKKTPTRIVPVLKVLATIIFGLLLFANMIASKYFVFALAKRLEVTEQLNSNERIQDIRCFILLFFIILCPNVISFLRTSWVGGFREDVPWPNKVQVFKALITSGLETCGLCIFVYKIFSFYSLLTSQLLLNSVILLPALQALWKCYKSRQQNSFYKIIYFLVAILATTASICTMALVIMESSENSKYIWHAVIGSLCLSISWSNYFWDGVLNCFSHNGKKEDIQHQVYQSFISSVNVSNGASSSGFVSGETSTETLSTPTTGKQRPGTGKSSGQSSFWKLGMVSNMFKICFTCLFSFLFYFVDNQNYPPELTFTGLMYEEFRKAWDIPFDTQMVCFICNILVSIVGYFLGFYACHACLKRGAFAIPILASLIIVPVLLAVPRSCQGMFDTLLTEGCSLKNSELPLAYCTIALFTIAFILLSVGLFKKEKIVLDKEENIFWVPAYNGVMLDQWLLVNKKDQFIWDEDHETGSIRFKPLPRVYICTTMYHETSEEMKELLKSINRINLSRTDDRFYESHIVFDGGLNNTSLSKYALQLIILLKETLGINPEAGTKVVTPYGLKLSWQLPKEHDMRSMFFNIHLKDNLKVKNKKRWSQIMYMSFILDFLTKDAPNEECYILTTDADVKFTPSSVEALLDLMIRDDSVGAVCARTHPMGSGLLAWYQNFDYAVGHWFQKASEHVLGSVLCAPGCFSVYRCKAIQEVLPKYATTVECADDFLIKDMGEDRWLCTLLLQCGWRIEYCAAAQNSTNCPDQFDEFFKQRRRWIVSTIANMMLIINKWSLIRKFNNQISVLFLFYQCILLLSTLIGPSTVALLVSGGLSYSWGINSLLSIILQIIIALFFISICLYAPQNYQLNIAKVLTFFYSVIMCAVAVGTIIQIVDDFNNSGTVKPTTGPFDTTTPSSNGLIDIPVSVTTMYFGMLIGLFTITALLHPTEFLSLLSGGWYLLCLPAGYIVLTLYSVCNITDRSWGTREEKVFTPPKPKVPWMVTFSKFWKILCLCCFKTKLDLSNTDEMAVSSGLETVIEESLNEPQPSTSQQTSTGKESPPEADLKPEVNKSADDLHDNTLPVPVEDWLPDELRNTYVLIFKENGFDNTMFISAMNKKDLKNMGLENKSHIQYILDKLKLLPTFEVEFRVPDSVHDWLDDIGLEMYKTNFDSSVIIEISNLKILKSYSEEDVKEQLGIKKTGHIKRLLYAISRLRNPTEGTSTI